MLEVAIVAALPDCHRAHKEKQRYYGCCSLQARPERSKSVADPPPAGQPKPARSIAAQSDRPGSNVRRPPPMAFGSRVNDERMPSGTASKRPRSVQVRCQDHHLYNRASISSSGCPQPAHGNAQADLMQQLPLQAPQLATAARQRQVRQKQAADGVSQVQMATMRNGQPPPSQTSTEKIPPGQQKKLHQMHEAAQPSLRPEVGLSNCAAGSTAEVARPARLWLTCEASCIAPASTCQHLMTTADQQQPQQQQQHVCSAAHSQQHHNDDADPSPTSSIHLPDGQTDAAQLAQWVAVEMAARLDAQVPLCAFTYCNMRALMRPLQKRNHAV